MTTPAERTNAVIETRRFLQMLAYDDNHTDPDKIRECAIRLLRHYPLDIDLSVSASALPKVWTAPEQLLSSYRMAYIERHNTALKA
ncbi:BPSL0761 family protein [Paraburkholderia xenovorans]